MGSQRNFIVNRHWTIDIWGYMGREYSILVKFHEVNEFDEMELTSEEIDLLVTNLRFAQKELDEESK